MLEKNIPGADVSFDSKLLRHVGEDSGHWGLPCWLLEELDHDRS